MTPAESLLWDRLRNRQLAGLKFHRQHPLGPFIVDFYCAANRLVVELDGPIHATQQEHDRERAQHLERSGYRLIRFPNSRIFADIEEVFALIGAACRDSARREN